MENLEKTSFMLKGCRFWAKLPKKPFFGANRAFGPAKPHFSAILEPR